MNKPRARLLVAAALSALLALFLGAFLIVNVRGFVRFCDADMQADVQVASLMREQGTLFPDNWIFGNQFYVAATPVLCALLMRVVPSPNLAMGLSTTIMGALVLLSALYLLRPFAGKTARLFALVTLAAGIACENIAVSRMGQLFFLMASYYACYVVTAFLVYGVWLRLRFTPSRGRAWAMAPVALALSFAMGMQSLRQTQVMVLPLLLVEAICFARDAARRRPKRLGPAAFALLAAAANMLGLLAIRALSPEQRTLYDSFPTDFTVPLTQRVGSFLSAFGDAAGLTSGGALSPLPVLLPALLLLLLTLLDLALQALRPRGERAIFAAQGLCLLGVLGVLPATFLSSFVMRSTYLFMYYPLAALCLCDLAIRAAGRARIALSGALCLIALVNFTTGVLPCVRASFSTEKTDAMRIADWMAENDYDVLYGYWWDVGRVLAAADGRVQGSGWIARPLQVQPYITLTDVYGEDLCDWAIYMLREEDREEVFAIAEEMGAVLTEQARIGEYALYTSDFPLMYYADR